jgi:serine kinase of HPr protein (carbohydrate metabolism regulator)
MKMKLKNLIEKYELEVLTGNPDNEREITGGYSGDLLSDVIANTDKNNVWITMQTHMNIIAVASLKELSAIIIVMNRQIENDVLEKAKEEKITILRTDKTAFQVSGLIYSLGVN